VVAAARDRAPVSVALGELQDGEVAVAGLAEVSFAKIGLAGCQSDPSWREKLRQLWQSLPPSVQPVAVMYADWQAAEAPSPEAVLKLAAECRVRHILIDTYVKSAGRLLDHWPLAELGRFSAHVADLDQQLVLAGSLDAESIAQVLPLQPWAIAVRGAVCRNGREGVMDTELVATLRDALATASTTATSCAYQARQR
jgi:uncharacterized protein (UPF0264 family)